MRCYLHTIETSTFISRAEGALLGLALGDALGTTLEFTRKDSYTPITDMLGGGPFALKAGQWTDDTSMALCLADSLLAKGKLDLDDQMQRYIRWWQQGENSVTGRCFDIGNTVSSALQNYTHSHNPYSGSTSEHSAGNGSLMRLAPIAIFFAPNKGFSLVDALDAAKQSSLTTHGEIRAYQACQVMSWLLYQVFSEECIDKQTLLSNLASAFDDLHPQIMSIVQGSFLSKQREQIFGSGFVVQSLEAALWCFAHSDDFEQGALLAANLGDDADTTAAIYGQLAGAFYGIDALPKHWLKKLAWKEKISDSANLLAIVPSAFHSLDFCYGLEQEVSASMINHCVYQYNLVLNFDWTDFANEFGHLLMKPLAGRSDIEQVNFINQLSYIDALKMITTIIRQNRFCDGLVELFIEEGSFQLWLQRFSYLVNYRSTLNNNQHAEISSLFFVGDVHGQFRKMTRLLKQAGMVKARPDDFTACKAVFVGDLIDNQALPTVDHINTLEYVKSLVERGDAYCVMGNHELNAIGWLMQDSKGQPLREHSERNRKQHQVFLQQVGENTSTHLAWIEWFKSLPFFLSFESVNVIHAAWQEDRIASLRKYLNPDNSLQSEYWPAVFDKTHELYGLCEDLLKGIELQLPQGKSFQDKYGNDQHCIRFKWWLNHYQGLTYRDVAQVPTNQQSLIPCLPLTTELDKLANSELLKDTVVGHYTLDSQAGLPKLLKEGDKSVICVDYNGAKEDQPLVGYRYHCDRKNAAQDNFIYDSQIDFEYELISTNDDIAQDWLSENDSQTIEDERLYFSFDRYLHDSVIEAFNIPDNMIFEWEMKATDLAVNDQADRLALFMYVSLSISLSDHAIDNDTILQKTGHLAYSMVRAWKSSAFPIRKLSELMGEKE